MTTTLDTKGLNCPPHKRITDCYELLRFGRQLRRRIGCVSMTRATITGGAAFLVTVLLALGVSYRVLDPDAAGPHGQARSSDSASAARI